MASGGHPLIDGMCRAGALSDLFNLPLRKPDGECWIEARSLFMDDDERLRDLVMEHGRRRWGTEDPHVAGSAFIIAYLTRVIWPVAAQYVLARRVIDARLNNLAFQWDGRRIDGTALNRPHFAALSADPASVHPDALAVAGPADLYAQLIEWLFASNLTVVIASLRRAARSSLKVSWNAVAASFAQAFHRLYDTMEAPATVVRDASVFFDDPSSPLYRQVTMEVFTHQAGRGFFSRRAGCCLWWRTAKSKDYCSNCVLLSREEQDERFRQTLENPR